MPSLVEIPANAMDLGLDLRSIRNLKIGSISSGASARLENGSAIYTGPGFRTATDLGTSDFAAPLAEGTVFPLLWAKSGTVIKYMTDPDSGTSYSIGAVVTSTEFGDFHEQGNGDFFYINQTDAPLRIAVARNILAIGASDTFIRVGADWYTKFATPVTAVFTADSTTDVFTATSHGLSTGNIVTVQNSGGALPAGLAANTRYFVIAATANTFRLSTTLNGTAIDITTNGTGTQTFTTGIVDIQGNVISYLTKNKGKVFTADSTTDTLTSAAHGLAVNDAITVSNSGGALPTGLTAATTYYVINITTNTFQLAATLGGVAIDITANGSGTQTLLRNTGIELTDVSGLPSGFAINTIITQITYPSTFSSTYNGTFMFDLESRLFTGGRLKYENVLSFSGPEDLTHPQYFYDFVGNGAFQRVFTGKLTGGIKGIGRAYVFTNDQTYQTTGINLETGALDVEPVSEEYGAYNPRCIVDMEGTVAFFGKKRLIPIELQLAAAGGSQPSLGLKFDDRLKPWLSSLDDDSEQGDAKLHYDKTTQILKIQARRNGALETYCYDRSNDSFLPAEIRTAKDYTMFNGKSYFGHINNGKIYHDDYGMTNDGLPIYHAWATGEIEYDKGRRYMQGYSLQYTGYMSKGSEHTLNVYVDESTVPSYSQLFNDSLITEDIGMVLGSNLMPSAGTIGGSQDIPRVYRFKNEILLIGISGESYRIEWITIKEGVYLKVSDFLLSIYKMNQNIRTRS